MIEKKALTTLKSKGKKASPSGASKRTRSKPPSQAKPLRYTKDFATAVLDTIGALVVVLDLKGRILNFNKACQDITGYTFQEVRNRVFWDFLLIPEEVNQVKSTFRKLKAGQFPNRFENYWIAKDGVRRRISWSNTVLTDAAGEVELIIGTGLDITEHKEAEEDLRRNRARLAWVLERTGVGTWLNELPLGRLNWDEQTRSLFFVPPEAEPTIELFWSRIHPDDREPTRVAVEKAIRERTLYQIDHRAVNPETGEIRWIRSMGQATYAADGTPTRFDGINYDITERKYTEQVLQESREDLKRAQEVAQTGSWRLNVQKDELLWSDENWQIFGVPQGTPLTYETFLSTVHPDDRAYVDRKWKAALRGEPYDIEHRIVVDGGTKWLRERAELEFDHDGMVLGGFGTTQDITEKKLAEEEIAKLAKFPSENPNPVFRLNSEGLISYANQPSRTFLRHWGVADGDIAPDLFRRLAADAIEDASVKRADIHQENATWSFSVTPIADMGYVNFYGTDITERKRAEDALRKSEQELRAAQRDLELKVQERTSEIREKAELIDSLFQYTLTPLALLDRTFNFVRVNQAYARVCARATDEFPGKNHFVLYPHEENELIFRRVVETKIPYQVFAKPFVFPDHPEWGVTYWDWTLTPLLDNAGEVNFLLFSLNDVTSRIKTQEKVKLERNRLKTILDNLSDGVLIVGKDYHIQYINPALEKDFGPVQGRKCHQYFHGLRNACSWCRNSEVLAGNSLQYEWTFGESGKTYELLSTPFLNNDGSVSKMQIFRDITERKEKENRILVTDTLLGLFVKTSSRQEYLEAVVQAIHDWSGCRCVGIRVTDSRGFIPYEAYTGFSHEFWKLENMLSLDKDMCACIRAITGQFEPQDASVRTPNGSVLINNSQEFLNVLTEEEKSRFRGNCIRSGFLSIGLIPVRYGGNTIGLIHLADEREGKMPFQAVQFLESVSSLIGEAIHRFNMEESLRRSEARLNEAQAIAHIGNWDWTIETNALSWSDEIYRIFGVSRSQFGATYEAVLDFIHPDDREAVREAVTRAFFEQQPYSVVHRIVLSSGAVKTVQERGEIIFDQNDIPLRIVGTIQDITEQKMIEERLRASQEQLRNLYAHMQKMREQEREHIAREIHDEFGTMLTALKIDVSWLEKKLSSQHPELLERLHKDLELLSSAIKTVQRISSELRPGILDHLGLSSAVEWQVKEFGERMGIAYHVGIDMESADIDRDVAISVFRILQESLTNIARHASASQVQVTLTESNNTLHMEITDDGLGITDDQLVNPQSFGLIGIRERVEYMGGEAAIGRAPQSGTRVSIRIPFRQGVAR